MRCAGLSFSLLVALLLRRLQFFFQHRTLRDGVLMPWRVVGPLARVGLRLEVPDGTLPRSRDTASFVPLYWRWTRGQVPSTSQAIWL